MAKTAPVPDLGAPVPGLALVSPTGVRTTLHAVLADSAAVVCLLRTSTCGRATGTPALTRAH
jgi:hypothetical protein